MATIDAKTNVYEISRSTIPSIIDIQQYITNTVNTEINNTYNPADPGDPSTWTEEDILNLFNGWIEGMNFVYDPHSDSNVSWYTLSIGLKSEFEDKYVSTDAYSGLFFETMATDRFSSSFLNTSVASTFLNKDDADNIVSAAVSHSIGTYTDAVKAYGYTTNVLSATYNGLNARIVEDAKVWAGDARAANSVEYASIDAMLSDTTQEVGTIAKVVVNTYTLPGSDPVYEYGYYQFVGDSIIGLSGTGWVKTSGAEALDGVSTLGTSKSIYTDPITGAVTGWQYAGGSGIASQFILSADNFKVQSSNGDVTPFNVDSITGEVTFSGNGGAKLIKGIYTSIPSTYGHSKGDYILVKSSSHVSLYKLGYSGWKSTGTNISSNNSRTNIRLTKAGNTGVEAGSDYYDLGDSVITNDVNSILPSGSIWKDGDMFTYTSTNHDWVGHYRWYATPVDGRHWLPATVQSVYTKNGDEAVDANTVDAAKDEAINTAASDAANKANVAKAQALVTARNNIASKLGFSDYNDMVTSYQQVKDGTTITGGMIETGLIDVDVLLADYIYVGDLNANQITSGTLDTDVLLADYVYAGDLSANQIKTGTLDVGDLTVTGKLNVTNMPGLSSAKYGLSGTATCENTTGVAYSSFYLPPYSIAVVIGSIARYGTVNDTDDTFSLSVGGMNAIGAYGGINNNGQVSLGGVGCGAYYDNKGNSLTKSCGFTVTGTSNKLSGASFAYNIIVLIVSATE